MQAKLQIIIFSFLVFCLNLDTNAQDQKLKIMVIQAHPDDPDETCGGTLALYRSLGHDVKIVVMTNGDAGHETIGGGVLARTRQLEAKKAGEIIGAEYLLMDNHDGELEPSLHYRKQVINLIRNYQPDIIITHRKNDYHPDHRYTGQLVEDASIAVMVVNNEALTPEMKIQPVILYTADEFKKPYPFIADMVVDIEKVWDKKMQMYCCHVCQHFDNKPHLPKTDKERFEWMSNRYMPEFKERANKFREKLKEIYGKEKGSTVKYAEAFELSEYRRFVNSNELKKLFPFIE